MNDLDLASKMEAVVRGCKTPEQYQGALHYLDLAEKWYRKRFDSPFTGLLLVGYLSSINQLRTEARLGRQA